MGSQNLLCTLNTNFAHPTFLFNFAVEECFAHQVSSILRCPYYMKMNFNATIIRKFKSVNDR